MFLLILLIFFLRESVELGDEGWILRSSGHQDAWSLLGLVKGRYLLYPSFSQYPGCKHRAAARLCRDSLKNSHWCLLYFGFSLIFFLTPIILKAPKWCSETLTWKNGTLAESPSEASNNDYLGYTLQAFLYIGYNAALNSVIFYSLVRYPTLLWPIQVSEREVGDESLLSAVEERSVIKINQESTCNTCKLSHVLSWLIMLDE